MKSTRMRIMDYLTARGTASVSELSRALNLTTANVRHHLSILVAQGSLEIVAEESSGRRGRPAHIYALTRESHLHSLHHLAGAFFDEFIHHQSPDIKAKRLKMLAERMIGTKPASHRHLSHQLVLAVQRLNELNYQARWEAHADAPHLRLEHCPYPGLVEDHPDICHLDAILIGLLVGRKVTLTEQLAPDTRGLRHCLFKVTPTIFESGNTSRNI